MQKHEMYEKVANTPGPKGAFLAKDPAQSLYLKFLVEFNAGLV